MMEQRGIAFAACTGKQCERVEELFGDQAAKIWILGDSATRIKHQGGYVFESLLPNALGQRLIQRLEKIADDHVIIACTPTAAYIKETTTEEMQPGFEVLIVLSKRSPVIVRSKKTS